MTGLHSNLPCASWAFPLRGLTHTSGMTLTPSHPFPPCLPHRGTPSYFGIAFLQVYQMHSLQILAIRSSITPRAELFNLHQFISSFYVFSFSALTMYFSPLLPVFQLMCSNNPASHLPRHTILYTNTGIIVVKLRFRHVILFFSKTFRIAPLPVK